MPLGLREPLTGVTGREPTQDELEQARYGPYARKLQEEADRQQLQAARLYETAGDPAAARGVVSRGRAAQQYLGAAGVGGLAGRQAQQAATAESARMGAQALQQGSQERMRAADMYMQAQSQDAAYMNALMDAQMRRRQFDLERERRFQQAQDAMEQAQSESDWRRAGALMSGISLGLAGSSQWSGYGGQGGGQ